MMWGVIIPKDQVSICILVMVSIVGLSEDDTAFHQDFDKLQHRPMPESKPALYNALSVTNYLFNHETFDSHILARVNDVLQQNDVLS